MSLFTELSRRNVIRVAVAYLTASWLLIQVADTVFPVYGLGADAMNMLITALAIGLPLFLVFSWVFEITPEGLKLETAVDRAVSTTHKTGKQLDRVIVALPFVNMSDDAGNEYFSDGVSEELLNLLAKIPELRVISRSSAFSFKGKDIDTPTIARQLGVAYILEGSVRIDGVGLMGSESRD